MSLSADHPFERRSRPRVGIIRGAVTSDRPVMADVRVNLPVEVLDPVAVEAGRIAAEEAGYADGYAAGLARADQEAAAARTAHDQQVMQAITALMGAVNQLRTREAATLHTVADQAASLALHLAAQVLQHEVAATENPGREAIARAMGLVPEDGDIRIHLNPDDLAVLGPIDDLAPGRGVDLIADASVQSGGALLSVGATRIDARLDSALARIAEVLR